ncbi:MAG TPA: radical SAM protein [Bryobacteraceae bacterium]|nr:radical SAM protein [Bryobacteraceae bacterium]
MKTLLVQPPLTISPEVHPPLGLSVLASHLVRSAQAVSIVDLDLQTKQPHSNPDQYMTEFRAALCEQRPQVVGFTSMFNNSLHAERLIRAAKEVDGSITTIAGGSHFGALPRESLERIPELDFVVRGEGEIVLSKFLSALDARAPVQDIPGLCYRASGAIRLNPNGPLLNLDRVNPTWSDLEGILNLKDYTATIPDGPRKRAVYIEAGRGCPFACSFCATAPFWERRYRVKPIGCIVEEMRYLHEHFGYDMFMLVHDLLTVDRRFVSDLCDALFLARLPVEWTANHRADIELGELAPKMRSAGCFSVFMGIESASERVQKDIHKGLTRAQTMSTVRSLMDVGISSTCSFIVGFPSETSTDLSATLELAAELKMIGAEPVQVHRLRRWPPAPLAALDLKSSFDIDALRLEYPSDTILDTDIETIQADPKFFIGYFTPETTAGSPVQLAQLELFFANALTMLPVTTAVLGRIYGNKLVDSYYKALEEQGPVSRADFHSAVSLRATLVPYILRWLESDNQLHKWQRDLLRGVILYERIRIGFMAQADDAYRDAVLSSRDWGVFTLPIDIAELLKRLTTGAELTSDLCTKRAIALTRKDIGIARGFALSEQSVERLRQGDPDLLAALEKETAH